MPYDLRPKTYSLYRASGWGDGVRVERECFKATQGFWGMPRGGVPTKDVPSGDTR